VDQVQPAGAPMDPKQGDAALLAQAMPGTPEQNAPGSVIPPDIAPPPPPPPSPTPGVRLPVVRNVKVDGMQVAITVDDCFQLDNVVAIAQLAMDNGVKLTFFPVGRSLKRDAGTWKWIYDNGFEIECHTYHHTNLLKLDEDEIRKDLALANEQLDKDLGFHYTYNFLRTPGGAARNDPRVHAIMDEMGFQIMAHWKRSGTGMSVKKMAKLIKPGDVVLYHSTDTDLKKLKELIPRLVQQGFQLVTLNELCGLEPNATSTPADDAAGAS
jgi:peptidoglycan/xylan/chitin deacetylase (PgdA/CDA1 family)